MSELPESGAHPEGSRTAGPAAKPESDLRASGETDRPVFLPRRTLSVGAVGKGEGQRRFRILTPLDRGGMGELFLAEVTEPGVATRFAVLKRLLADLIDDKKYVAMFLTEARVMSRLSHPNIVRVFDIPIVDNAQCLAMEYVRGKNAQQILARAQELGQKLPAQMVLRMMAQVLRALDYAHGFKQEDGAPLNLVHRDVTPGNVLVSYEGDVKLTDFGIAKSELSAVSTTVGIVKGKARYLAPEQILGEQATPRADIFAAASVTLELLTGAPLFDRGTVPKTLYAIVHGERPETETQLSFRAPLLVQVLNRALATDPRQRMQTARELAEGLEAAARLLGKPADREILGAWMRELFRDLPDPLARFTLHPRSAPPVVEPAEPATQHAYAAELRSDGTPPAEPMDDPLTVQAAPIALLVGTPSPDLSVEAREALGPALAEPAGLPRKEPPRPVAETVAARPQLAREAEAEPSDPRRAPTLVVRGVAAAAPMAGGRIADPAADEPPAGEEATLAASVEEALSALAFIQAEEHAKRRPESDAEAERVAAERSATVVHPSTPRLDPEHPTLRPGEVRPVRGLSGRALLAALFAGGALCGVLCTLSLQAVLHEEPPRPPPPEEVEELTVTDEELAAAEAEAAATSSAAPRPELLAPTRAGEAGLIDLLEPRGARVRLNGVWLKEKVPLRAYPVKAGRHQLRLLKGKKAKDVAFSIEPGERLDLTRRILRRPRP